MRSLSSERLVADGGSWSPPSDQPAGIAIRRADADDVVDVIRVLEGALLEIDAAVLRSRVGDGRVLLAETDPATEGERTRTVVGALSLESRDDDGSHVAADDRLHIDAVAVTRHRREVGIGSALVRAAIDAAAAREVDHLTAAFEGDLREFYADLGFRIEPIEGTDRLRGIVDVGALDRRS
ncbi:GNAT family N-acetyltransferase [Halopenitus persicus]|uniref:Ribosomal protein S18 acetylase RimI n=1 Tax=Halopenitus persicus TaxID=1048396 RepID=A0A1H3I833_9EURY|nr:GNAT family N-acetyltransferase [Halopenitus persicus]SDY23913.1 Ribosomal protein S18 acetylase RimI [Halopenitus persicus]